MKNGYCYASNDYLANYVNTSVRMINYSLSKLKDLKYIIVKYENSKRIIYLNIGRIPAKVRDEDAENCTVKDANSCTHNINSNKYKKKYNKRTEIIPYWMEHTEVCVSEPLSEEEQREMDELMKEYK